MYKLLVSLIIVSASVIAHADPIDLVCKYRYVITMTASSNKTQISKLIKKNFAVHSSYTSDDGYTIVTAQAYRPEVLPTVIERIFNLGGSVECDNFHEGHPRLGGSN